MTIFEKSDVTNTWFSPLRIVIKGFNVFVVSQNLTHTHKYYSGSSNALANTNIVWICQIKRLFQALCKQQVSQSEFFPLFPKKNLCFSICISYIRIPVFAFAKTSLQKVLFFLYFPKENIFRKVRKVCATNSVGKAEIKN